MSADNFVITKGSNNVFEFTIKQTGSTEVITIETGDTFTAKLRLLDTNAVVLTKTRLGGGITVPDANSGKIALTITPSDTDALTSLRGDSTDRYYLKPVYSLILECTTAANGSFIAKVDNVYVN